MQYLLLIYGAETADGNSPEVHKAYLQALEMAPTEPERRLMLRRLREVGPY